MKLLRIINNKGEFSIDGETFNIIDSISRDDIKKMMLLMMNQKESFEFDDPKISEIVIPSQKLIYTNLYIKFEQLMKERNEIMEKVDLSFKEAFQKYSS